MAVTSRAVGFVGLANSHPHVDAVNLLALEPSLTIYVTDEQEALAEGFVQECRGAIVVEDLHEMLARGVDGVVLTDVPSRVPFLLGHLLESGCPTFVNKPGAVTVDQVEMLVALGSRGRVMSSSVLRYAPGIRRLAGGIDRSALLSVRIGVRHGIGHWRFRQNAWQADPMVGGGVVGSLGYHGFEIAEALLGGLFGVAEVVPADATEEQDALALSLKWTDGIVGTLELSPSSEESYEVTLIFVDGTQSVTLRRGELSADGFGYRGTMAAFLRFMGGDVVLPWARTAEVLRAGARAHQLVYGGRVDEARSAATRLPCAPAGDDFRPWDRGIKPPLVAEEIVVIGTDASSSRPGGTSVQRPRGRLHPDVVCGNAFPAETNTEMEHHVSVFDFHGVVPPILTPFTSDGEVDVASLERLAESLVQSGVHGLFVLGSTGEVAYLDDGQRDLVVRTVVRAVNGRVPVMVGVIELTSARVVHQAHAALDAGADAIVATAPIYAINDMAEIEAHFRAIRAKVNLPLFAYDIPARVGTKLPAGMLVRLGVDGVLAGVKDSSGDDVGFRRLVAANAAAGSPLALFTGHEVVVDGMLLLGADGVVPGLGNVDAAGYVRLWGLAKEGRWDEARAEQDRLAALFEIVFQASGRSGDASGVGSFKAAAQQQGLIDTRAMAFPVQGLDGEVVDRIEMIVREAGLLDA